ncbi:MAG TPA: PadR family transcriptional regulator [Streptosporangiaceae bacterium]|nr:PadR family transcriptional regulator [Streptosporangiaceae bacterium]
MRYDEERGGRRGPGRWEPADDGEGRRWHGDDERHGGRGRARSRAREHFGGPFGGPGFGPGFGGPGFPGGPEGFGPPHWREPRGMRGPRARRGDVRAAALALLAEQPMNGYQIIQEIAERSGGVWRPSPGSIYPALQQLEDEGLIRAEAGDGGRRAFQLTDEGRAYAAAHTEELNAPWDVVAGSAGGAAIEMRRLIGQVAMAAFQVISAGTDAQAGQARQVLTDTRKSLYRILAADEDEAADPAGDGE